MDIKSMIQEKILVEAEFSKKPTGAIGLFIIAVLCGLAAIIPFIANAPLPWEYYLVWGIITALFLIAGICATNSSTDWGYELYVTNSRIVGKSPLGQLISIPIEQISSVETERGVLVIKTPSTTVGIPYMTNLTLVFAHISNLTAGKKQLWKL